MERDVRFLIFNRDERCSKELRAALHESPRTKLVAELDEGAMLRQAIKQFHADAVLINLDPSPESILPLVEEIGESESGVTFFAVSESTEGPLILKAMRMGVREFFPKPIDAGALIDAVDKLAQHRSAAGAAGQLINVVGSAGGVGATTLATNLAVELAATSPEGSVAVVDLDYRFGQVATILDLEPTFTLADLCDGMAYQ